MKDWSRKGAVIEDWLYPLKGVANVANQSRLRANLGNMHSFYGLLVVDHPAPHGMSGTLKSQTEAFGAEALNK